MLINKQYKQFISSPKFTNRKFDEYSSSFNSVNLSRTTTPNGKDYIKTQEINLFFSYFRNFSIYKLFKQKYQYLPIFSDNQKRSLMSQTKICRKDFQEQAIFMLSSPIEENNNNKVQLLTILIIFGNLYWKSKKYSKNQSICIEKDDPLILTSLIGEEAICIYLCQKRLQEKISQINHLHHKKKLIQKHLTKGLGELKKKQMSILATKTQLINWSGQTQLIKAISKQQIKKIQIQKAQKFKYYDEETSIESIEEQKCFICLISGIYQVIDTSGNVLTQVQDDYFGQEILWKDYYQFGLRNKSFQFSYLIVPKLALKQCFLNDEQFQSKIQGLKRIYKVKKQKRLQLKNFQTVYHQQMEKITNKEKIKERIKKPQKFQQFQQMLENMKKLKPQWQTQQEFQKQKLKNLRNNKFKNPEQYHIPPSKHFSKLEDKQDKQQNLKFARKYYSVDDGISTDKRYQDNMIQLASMQVSKTYSSFGKTLNCQTKTRQQMSKTMYAQVMNSTGAKYSNLFSKKELSNTNKKKSTDSIVKRPNKIKKQFSSSFNLKNQYQTGIRITSLNKTISFQKQKQIKSYKTQPNLVFKESQKLQQSTKQKNQFQVEDEDEDVPLANQKNNTVLAFKQFEKKQKKIFDVDKWNHSYSEYYDRSLSNSLSKIKKMKRYEQINSNAYPKKYPFIFSLEDAMETKKLTFYQIKKKQKTELFEMADKRKLQKIFKTKLLTTGSTTCPQTFR